MTNQQMTTFGQIELVIFVIVFVVAVVMRGRKGSLSDIKGVLFAFSWFFELLIVLYVLSCWNILLPAQKIIWSLTGLWLGAFLTNKFIKNLPKVVLLGKALAFSILGIIILVLGILLVVAFGVMIIASFSTLTLTNVLLLLILLTLIER